jgi:hypothetical protein
MKVEGDASGRLVAAARGAKGELTVLALNQADKPQEVAIRGMPASRAFHVITWNANGEGRLTVGGVAKARAGVYVVTLPPMALSALTSVPSEPLRGEGSSP